MDIVGYFDEAERPRLEVEIITKKISGIYRALLDSGADYCLLPKTIGLDLGLKMPTKPSGTSHGVGGEVPVKHVRLNLLIGSFKLKTTFAWFYTQDNIPVIIGRKGIFDQFNIDFRQKEGKIIFRKN